MSKGISILCPSRGRPGMANKMEQSAINTANGDVEVLFYLNNDDPELDKYDVKTQYVGHDAPTAYSWNLLAKEAKYDVLVLMGDDAVFKTPGWDDELHALNEQYDDGIWCAGFYDGREKGSYPHFAVSKVWADTLGYFVPPIFFHWHVDTWTTTLAKNIYRFHGLDDILIEHQTPKVTGKVDETFARIRNAVWPHRDRYVADIAGRYMQVDEMLLRKQMGEIK